MLVQDVGRTQDEVSIARNLISGFNLYQHGNNDPQDQYPVLLPNQTPFPNPMHQAASY